MNIKIAKKSLAEIFKICESNRDLVVESNGQKYICPSDLTMLQISQNLKNLKIVTTATSYNDEEIFLIRLGNEDTISYL